MTRTPIEPVPVVPWSTLWSSFTRRYRADRDNAQHVAIIGPTGAGKSTLALRVAELRPYVVHLVEKPRDAKLRNALRRGQYRIVDELPDAGGYRRVVIWPPAGGVEDEPRQQAAFRAAMRTAGRVGVWHTVIHEAPYMVDPLGLHRELKYLLRMGRSNGAGVIVCAQRPVWLPRDIYSQSDHLFLFGTNDSSDLKALGGLNGMDERRVRETVAQLGADGDRHRFLYVGTRDGTLAVSRAPSGL